MISLTDFMKQDEFTIGDHRVYFVDVPVWKTRSLGLSEERAVAGFCVACRYHLKDGSLWTNKIYKPDISRIHEYRAKDIKGRRIIEFPIADMEVVGNWNQDNE